jgi:hypothetical protein
MDKKLLKAFIVHQELASVAVLTPDYDKTEHSASRKSHSNAAVVIIGAGISGTLQGCTNGPEARQALTTLKGCA